MSIIFDKEKLKGEWVQYDDVVSFLVRPFPISEKVLRPGQSMDINLVEVIRKQSSYVLQGWRGIVDVNGNEVPYTDENKATFLEYSEEIVRWLCEQSRDLNAKTVNISQKKI
jgi:hypothetical protein